MGQGRAQEAAVRSVQGVSERPVSRGIQADHEESPALGGAQPLWPGRLSPDSQWLGKNIRGRLSFTLWGSRLVPLCTQRV